MNLPEPQSVPYSTLINDIEKGLIKIPQFQRDFVWTKEKAAKLLDSILKGYPIGTFILWKTKESLRSIRNLGGAALPDTPTGEFIQYVLDGQQRLASLFVTLKGYRVEREKLDDFSEIYIDLTAPENGEIVVTEIPDGKRSDAIKIVDLIIGSLESLAKFPKKYHTKLDEYKRRLVSNFFSVIVIREVQIDMATEIFTRINEGGKPLSVFEIMVAKTFDVEKKFDLSEKYDELIEELRDVDYETISNSTILQVISIILEKDCSKRVILKLDKNKFIETWDSAIDAIKTTVDYFRDFYQIPVSKLLPYNALIVPFAYFFYHHPNKPTGNKQKYLQDFFWRTSLGGRYSHSLESRITQDIKKIDSILKDKPPKYEYGIDPTWEFIKENGKFSPGRSYIKAILCIFAHHQPKSFDNDALVRISNDWLKQANSKNYHHFFPKAYLKKEGYDEVFINHIANITIVDDFLNKRKIGANAPSKYMKLFKKENPQVEETIKTHLIDLKKFGVWENNYEKFFKERCMVIAKEIKKRVIPQSSDNLGQELNIDDLEESELET